MYFMFYGNHQRQDSTGRAVNIVFPVFPSETLNIR